MHYYVIFLSFLVVSAIAGFIFIIRELLSGTPKKVIAEIKKISITITNDNTYRKHPYTFKPMLSKDPKDILRECKKDGLRPSSAEDAKTFASHYSIMAHDYISPNYYKIYECWGLELKKGEIALIMKRV